MTAARIEVPAGCVAKTSTHTITGFANLNGEQNDVAYSWKQDWPVVTTSIMHNASDAWSEQAKGVLTHLKRLSTEKMTRLHHLSIPHWYDPIVHIAVNIVAIVGTIIGIGLVIGTCVRVRRQWRKANKEFVQVSQIESGMPMAMQRTPPAAPRSVRFSITEDGFKVAPLRLKHQPNNQ